MARPPCPPHVGKTKKQRDYASVSLRFGRGTSTAVTLSTSIEPRHKEKNATCTGTEHLQISAQNSISYHIS